MYLQITTRCNMKCGHCGFACTSRGKDMSMEVFKAALQLCIDRGESLSIGGGEPTIHPQFLDMLGWAIVQYSNQFGDDNRVWLATNGKETDIALRLADLARCGIISCELSQDDYHEPIDDKVVRAFEKPQSNGWDNHQSFNDFRGVRNTTKYREPIKAGRSKSGVAACICDDIFIKPNGDIHQCGCKDSPKLGNVLTDVPEYMEMNTCHKDLTMAENLV